jgi:uncharacterized protein YyaL (SSP411 family)
MLYDNAQLARVYRLAWQITHKDFYRRVAEQTLDYVAREMTDPQGGFYSRQDADSERGRGEILHMDARGDSYSAWLRADRFCAVVERARFRAGSAERDRHRRRWWRGQVIGCRVD